MTFRAKYVSVRVSGIGKVTKVTVLCKDGIVFEEDVLKAAQEAFASFGGLVKKPRSKSRQRRVSVQKRARKPS